MKPTNTCNICKKGIPDEYQLCLDCTQEYYKRSTLKELIKDFKDNFCPRIEATTNYGTTTYHAQEFDSNLTQLLEKYGDEQKKLCLEAFRHHEGPMYRTRTAREIINAPKPETGL